MNYTRFLSFFTFLSVVAILCSCEEPVPETKTKKPVHIDAFSKPKPLAGLFLLSLEKSHNAAAYRKHKNVRFEVTTTFGAMENVHAIITMSTNCADVKIENDDGTYLVYLESTTSFNEDSIFHDIEKFRHFAWSHFFSLPKRLRDDNVRITKFRGPKKLDNQSFRVRKVELEARPGFDNLFDWYVVYVDRATGLLRFAGYGLPEEINMAVNTSSHAIEYGDYKLIEDIPIAHSWTFWEWNPDTGLGEKLGSSKLENISFPEVDANFYE